MLSPSKLYRTNAPKYSLFSALGLFESTSLTIGVPSPDEFTVREEFTESIDTELSSAYIMAFLLHERVHWLQHIGTTTGLFFAFLADIQGSIVGGPAFHDKQPDLSPSDFPLLESSRHDSFDWTALWKAFETLHHIFGGNITVQALEQMNRQAQPYDPDNALALFSNLCGSTLRNIVHEASASTSPLLNTWPENNVITKIRRAPVVADSSGQLYGAQHLFEGAAYLNEMYKITQWYLTRKTINIFDSRPESIYGSARKEFYDLTELKPNGRSEIIFATLVDYALNPPLPPVTPYPIDDNYRIGPNLLPFLRFAELTKAIRHFPLTGTENFFVNQRSAVRDVVLSVYSFLEQEGFGKGPLAVFSFFEKALDSLSEIPIPEALYELDEQNLPRHKGRTGRFAFLIKNALEAIRIRREYPEFFVFPFCVYATDRKVFHQLYDPIAAPLVYRGSSIRTASDVPGWLVYFFVSAIHHDLGRWIVYCSFEDIVERLKKYAGALEDRQMGLTLTLAAADGFFQNERITAAIKQTL